MEKKHKEPILVRMIKGLSRFLKWVGAVVWGKHEEVVKIRWYHPVAWIVLPLMVVLTALHVMID